MRDGIREQRAGTSFEPVLAPAAGPAEHAGGFTGLLATLVEEAGKKASVMEACDYLLTSGGRYRAGSLVDRLQPLERYVVELFGGKQLEDRTLPPVKPSQAIWYIQVAAYGRVFVRPSCCEADALVGSFVLDEAETALVHAKVEQYENQHAAMRQEMRRFYEGITRERILEVLDVVRHGIDHIDQVLFYVNDQTFTNHAGFNALMHRTMPDRPGFLIPELYERPVSTWTDNERELVFCFWWVRQLGWRGEELNGRQLRVDTLGREIERKRRSYRRLLGLSGCYVPDDGSIQDRADELVALRGRVSASHRTIRWIDGLTFYKEEDWLPRSAWEVSVDTIPRPVTLLLRARYGVRAHEHGSVAEVFGAAVTRALSCSVKRCTSLRLQPFEELVFRLVQIAMEATDSDLGMTRGLRDLHAWQRAVREQRFGEMCDWPIAHYFCGVAASQRYASALGSSAMLAKALIAVARRMQFNSWHYMPGHVPAAAVPAGRHFFFPPVMPDRAEWTDQQHDGHVLAGVRFSIRSPAPLRYAGHDHPGMVDLRLMRSRGTPYTLHDLSVAIQYTEYLRLAYQALCDFIAGGHGAFRISAFERDWYEAYARTFLPVDAVQARESA